MTTTIRSLATANPPRYIKGEEAYRAMIRYFDMAADERDLYRRLLVEGPIRGRYISIEHDPQCMDLSPDQLLARFQQSGTAIASQAARDAVAKAGLRPQDLGGLVVNTCTGYLCPGLSSYVAQALDLPPSIHVMDLMGMGCGAAVPNLQCASGLLAMGNGEGKPILSVSVEVCSATMFMGPEPDLIVSNCLFGDGAAAVVLDRDGDNGGGLVRLIDFESAIFPADREALRYRHENGRLRNVLSKRVPILAGRAIRQVVDRLLARHGLSGDKIHHWIVHPGGETVLQQVEKELGLGEDSLRFSYEILHEYGNMSSPSVLFVLKRLLEQVRPQRKQLGLMLAFGAGFSAFAAMVEF